MTFLALAILLNTSGMAALALGMARHHRAVLGIEPDASKRKFWRIPGWLLLAAGLIPCLAGWGVSIGIVVWTGLLTFALLAVAFALAGYRKQGATR